MNPASSQTSRLGVSGSSKRSRRDHNSSPRVEDHRLGTKSSRKPTPFATWVIIDRQFTPLTKLASQAELVLKANGTFDEFLEHHGILDYAAHVTGHYRRIGSRLELKGTLRYRSRMGKEQEHGTYKNYPARLEISHGALILDGRPEDNIYFVRPGNHPSSYFLTTSRKRS